MKVGDTEDFKNLCIRICRYEKNYFQMGLLFELDNAPCVMHLKYRKKEMIIFSNSFF